MTTRLVGFTFEEEELLREALLKLSRVGYEVEFLEELIRVEMPAGYRAMSLANGAVLGAEALASLAMICHALEEELLHLKQKLSGRAEKFQPGSAQILEEEVDALRRFPNPKP